MNGEQVRIGRRWIWPIWARDKSISQDGQWPGQDLNHIHWNTVITLTPTCSVCNQQVEQKPKHWRGYMQEYVSCFTNNFLTSTKHNENSSAFKKIEIMSREVNHVWTDLCKCPNLLSIWWRQPHYSNQN